MTFTQKERERIREEVYECRDCHRIDVNLGRIMPCKKHQVLINEWFFEKSFHISKTKKETDVK